jgi:hypothetical protein
VPEVTDAVCTVNVTVPEPVTEGGVTFALRPEELVTARLTTPPKPSMAPTVSVKLALAVPTLTVCELFELVVEKSLTWIVAGTTALSICTLA